MELSLSELYYDDLFGSDDTDVPPVLPTHTLMSEEQILLDEFPEISFDELEQYMTADNILQLNLVGHSDHERERHSPGATYASSHSSSSVYKATSARAHIHDQTSTPQCSI